MPSRVVDCYEITAKILVRKDYLDAELRMLKGSLKEVLVDKIQQGIEVPCESIIIAVKN